MKAIITVTRLLFGLLLVIGIAAAFFISDTTHAQSPAPKIIAYGDSLIEGLSVTNSLTLPGQLGRLMGSEYTVINRGQNGAETEILLNNLQDRVLSEDPDIVILYGGGADLIPDFDNDGRVPAEETFANLREIIDRLQEAEITVVLLGHGSYDIPGYTFVDYTSEFRNLANDTNVYFMPDAINEIVFRSEYTLSDRIHPNARGYSVVTLRTFPVLQKAIYEKFPHAPLSGSCQVSTSHQDRPELVFEAQETVMTNQQIKWKAFAVGGFGNYRYDWEIDGISRRGREISTTYDTEGQKTARFDVSSRINDEETREETIQCQQVINIITPPLKGSCSVQMRIFDDEVQIHWNSNINGGETNRPYEYRWEIDGEVVSSSSQFKQTYDRDDAGEKSATVLVESGPHDAELSCNIEIPEEDSTSATSTLQRFSCNVNGYDFEIGDRVHWSVDVHPSSRHNADNKVVATTSVFWKGSGGLSTSSPTASVAYTSSGVKTASADIEAVTGEETAVSCQAKIVPDTDGRTRGGSGGGGCFIATAAFGTALASEIDVLRDFRDTVLLESRFGRGLVAAYYTVSPPIADYISKHESLRAVTRWMLRPVIDSIRLAEAF
ncbi:MAG: CFI-box-CTERM domain-containing protein [Candidatus Paceibacterota bacterium]